MSKKFILLLVAIGILFGVSRYLLLSSNKSSVTQIPFQNVPTLSPTPIQPNLQTKYIRGQVWPPTITISSDAYTCKEEGLGINGLPAMTIEKTVGDTTYCIRSESEGAAGTIYTNYSYTFIKNGKLVKLGFTLAYPQCDNYTDPNKTECATERQTFNLDSLIDSIAQTV